MKRPYKIKRPNKLRGSLIGLGLLLICHNLYSQAATKDEAFSFPHLRTSTSQPGSVEQVSLIASMPVPACHFAKVYSESMQRISEQMKSFDSSTQEFIRKFEIYFAGYFVRAYDDYGKGILPDSSEWNNFFLHQDLTPWQLVLFGVNAHTNIDLSLALINNFSADEIKKNKHHLLIVQRSIAKVYMSFFEEMQAENSYLRFLNSFTKGLAKIVGERWVYKWRKRNVKLAVAYFDDPPKFRRMLSNISKKKKKTDQLILKKKKFFLPVL